MNADLYRRRTARLAKLIQEQAPPNILVQDCWLTIKAYGVWRFAWFRFKYVFTILTIRRS